MFRTLFIQGCFSLVAFFYMPTSEIYLGIRERCAVIHGAQDSLIEQYYIFPREQAENMAGGGTVSILRPLSPDEHDSWVDCKSFTIV